MIEILEKKEVPSWVRKRGQAREEEKYKKKYGDDIQIGFEMEPGEHDVLVVCRRAKEK